jgi:hypothetical protein
VLASYVLLVHRRRASYFFLGALGPALALGLYHTHLFGRPWTLPYAQLDDPGYQLFHHGQGFLGVGRPRMRALGSSLFNADYGLFVFSPFLAGGAAAALWGFVRRKHRDHGIILAVSAVLLVLLAGMANWRAGWCAGGPRYIAAAVPFLAFALALAWKDVLEPRAWLRAVLTALVLVSVFLCLLAGAIFPHFPLQFDNPIFDLVIPLVREGRAPYSLGTLFGLSGAASLAPLGAVALVALGATLIRGRPARAWLSGTAASVALAAVLLAGLSAYGRRPRRDEDRARSYVREVWEPAPPSAGGPHGPA